MVESTLFGAERGAAFLDELAAKKKLPLAAKRPKKTATSDASDNRRVIQLVAGEMHRIVDAAELALAEAGKHFQRSTMIVMVYADPGSGEVLVQPVNQSALSVHLSGLARFERYDKRSESWAKVDPPARHVAALHDASSYRHLAVLNGLARQPYLRPDGSLVARTGYDATTGLYGLFDEQDFNVPTRPTRTQALAALALLDELLAEFPFRDEVAKAAALCAMLTAAIRSSLPTAPMVHVTAHCLGSGKSYLCELLTAMASSSRNAPATFPAEDEECRKLLLATLLAAPAVIEFDNLTTDLLPLKSLCVALTSKYFTGRILGVSKTATVDTRALFLSSGNNVAPVGDMTRRTLVIELDPRVENPAQREFKRPNLLSEVRRERAKYVSAALTIVLAWIAAGRSETPCRPVASYGEWTQLCRQPLLWLGQPDPAQSLFTAMAADPDREVLGRLLSAWHDAFGNRSSLIREAINDRYPDLLDVIKEIAENRGEIDRRRLGWWIKRHAGRIVDGLRFAPGDTSRNAGVWRVEQVASDKSLVSVLGNDVEQSVMAGVAFDDEEVL